MKLYKIFSLEDRAVRQKYGVIKTSILKYITPTMITVLVMCVALVTLNFEQVYANYSINIPLNSLILFVFLAAMIEAFNNNLNLLNVAHFFKKFEAAIDQPIVEDAQIRKFKKMLETSAYLINTQSTFKIIDSLQKHGHPLISEDEARLIKSKLGFRIKIQRSSVSFMAGILVMLGLIGTFWGLLLTIGAVGEAMNTIADQADSLGTDEGGIGGIITSISEPLQGMGLAFSSSLFGLSGSLVVGFFNYACGQAQDDAIEDFSRWIDEHIPQPGSEEEALKKEIDAALRGEDDEEAEEDEPSHSMPLAVGSGSGTGMQGNFDENVISQMLYTLKQSADASAQMSHNFEKLLSSQAEVHKVLTKEAEDLFAIRSIQGDLNAGIQSVAAYTKQNADAQSALSADIHSIVNHTQQSAETQIALSESIHSIADYTKQGTQTQAMLAQHVSSLVVHAQDNIAAHDRAFANMEERLKAQKSVYDTLLDGEKRAEKAHLEMRQDVSKINSTLDRSNTHFSTLEDDMKKAHAQELRLLECVLDIKGKIPQSEYKSLNKACTHIAQRIDVMNGSLQDNVKAMVEVSKEGNMQRMARILKEMQMFWMQMKLNTLDTRSKKLDVSDVED